MKGTAARATTRRPTPIRRRTSPNDDTGQEWADRAPTAPGQAGRRSAPVRRRQTRRPGDCHETRGDVGGPRGGRGEQRAVIERRRDTDDRRERRVSSPELTHEGSLEVGAVSLGAVGSVARRPDTSPDTGTGVFHRVSWGKRNDLSDGSPGRRAAIGPDRLAPGRAVVPDVRVPR